MPARERVEGKALREPRCITHPPAKGFRVQGPGFRVQGSGFRVQGPGFRVQGSGFRGSRISQVDNPSPRYKSANFRREKGGPRGAKPAMNIADYP